MDKIHPFQAFLLARDASEKFLIAYAQRVELSPDSFKEGVDKVRALVKHLGFELVPVDSDAKEAA